MFTSEALVAKFEFALNNRWGYIWGTAGVEWTQSKQNQKVNYMVSKYGNNWQKNADAKNDTYYSAAVYGSKWIGHIVADCSGLFAWAFKQLGGSIAHGSNSIYDRYCTSKKGKLTDALKKELLPGTAVFTGDASKHGHIGLYVGNGKVIEASGTQAGVCVSNITANKWTYYGLLKNVDYSGEKAPELPSDGKDEEIPMSNYPTVKRGSKGEYVTLLQKKLQEKGYNLGLCGVDGDFGPATERAVKAFQKDHGLTQDGICGQKTWAALDKPDEPVVYYNVVIPHLTESQAAKLLSEYPTAHKEVE